MNNDGLRAKLGKSVSDIQMLRDEIRVRLHLASLEAKNQWSILEPRLLHFEQQVKGRVESAAMDLQKAAEDLRSALKNLRERVR